jgi:hypothetical protein
MVSIKISGTRQYIITFLLCIFKVFFSNNFFSNRKKVNRFWTFLNSTEYDVIRNEVYGINTIERVRYQNDVKRSVRYQNDVKRSVRYQNDVRRGVRYQYKTKCTVSIQDEVYGINTRRGVRYQNKRSVRYQNNTRCTVSKEVKLGNVK